MNDILKNRVTSFLEYTGMPQAQLAEHVGVLNIILDLWLDDRTFLSAETENRIENFMSEYAAKLQSSQITERINKMKLLVIVDMQNDFIDGTLGSEAAQAIVPNVVKKIEDADKDTLIVFTMDTHFGDYDDTLEGRILPIKHCKYNTRGWLINDRIRDAWVDKDTTVINDPEFRAGNTIIKTTFGSDLLINFLTREGHNFEEIEFAGLCTDICLVSNVLMARAALPDMPITVDASCCAGTTPEAHNAALKVMRSCQINVV